MILNDNKVRWLPFASATASTLVMHLSGRSFPDFPMIYSCAKLSLRIQNFMLNSLNFGERVECRVLLGNCVPLPMLQW